MPRLRWVGLGLLLLLLASPLQFVVQGLVEGRDLGAAWRALRAPKPAWVAAPAPSVPAPFDAPRIVGSLRDPELVEVSGLAGSRRNAPLLWAVNDGGNPLRLHALSLDGEGLAAFDLDVPAAGDTDWEDLASFRWQGTAYLLIPDVGDNRNWRRSVRLWLVEEPPLEAAEARLWPVRGGELRFADGARDCEAVAVDEARGMLLLISKQTAPPWLYEADLGAWLAGTGAPGVARPVGPVAIPPPSTEHTDSWLRALLHMPTALDLAPDGSAAFVLSYAAGWRFPRAPGEPWAEAFARPPEQLALPPLALAEAAAYVGEALFVTSEVGGVALLRWPAPLVRFDPLPDRGADAQPSRSADARPSRGDARPRAPITSERPRDTAR